MGSEDDCLFNFFFYLVTAPYRYPFVLVILATSACGLVYCKWLTKQTLEHDDSNFVSALENSFERELIIRRMKRFSFKNKNRDNLVLAELSCFLRIFLGHYLGIMVPNGAVDYGQIWRTFIFPSFGFNLALSKHQLLAVVFIQKYSHKEFSPFKSPKKKIVFGIHLFWLSAMTTASTNMCLRNKKKMIKDTWHRFLGILWRQARTFSKSNFWQKRRVAPVTQNRRL